MLRLLLILTLGSAALFFLAAGLIAYADYRDRTDPPKLVTRRPSVEFMVRGSEWCFYASPGGLGFRLMHETEPKQETGVMTVDEWKAWSLKWTEDEPIYQFAGFSIMPKGQLSRTTRDHATNTFVGYDIGWWRAVFVPRWAAMTLPALLPLVMLIRWFRLRRAKAPVGFPMTATA